MSLNNFSTQNRYIYSPYTCLRQTSKFYRQGSFWNFKSYRILHKWIPMRVKLKRIPTLINWKWEEVCLKTRLDGQICSSALIKHKCHCQSRISFHSTFIFWTSFIIWTSLTSSDTSNRVTGITQSLFTFHLLTRSWVWFSPGARKIFLSFLVFEFFFFLNS